MQHFLEINQLNSAKIYELIDRALYLKHIKSRKTKMYCKNYDKKVITLFYENSTRTQLSFTLACENLSLKTFDLNINTASINKGETLVDTCHTLLGMGINIFIIRHPESAIMHKLINIIPHIQIINAGDGTNEHPTQAMLDLMTIFEVRKQVQDLNIAIIGNISHSRVAHSFQAICSILGLNNLRLIAPKIWQPKINSHGEVTSSLKEGIKDADVIMCLRIQQERLNSNEHYDISSYCKEYQLTKEHLKLAHPKVMIMHPGPINRGIEIEDSIVDSNNSYILTQVKNGVFMRMAILEALCTSPHFAVDNYINRRLI